MIDQKISSWECFEYHIVSCDASQQDGCQS
jgi:hypothetical protein